MIFRSKARTATYTMKPARRGKDMNGLTVTSNPLRAEFAEFIFDSEAAQRAMSWTDKERKQVENYLLGYADCRRAYWPDGEEMPMQVEEAQKRHRAYCGIVDEINGEAVTCGQITFGGSDYCKTHLLDLAKADTEAEAKVPETAREQRPVGV